MRSEAEVAGMLCPIDRTPLAMSDRQGIEIDYCPTCRGVWLDRGELDKIIERSGAAPMASGPTPTIPAANPAPSPWGSAPRYDDRGYDPRYGKKRKKSFLEELFD